MAKMIEKAKRIGRDMKARPVRTIIIAAVFAAPFGMIPAAALARFWK